MGPASDSGVSVITFLPPPLCSEEGTVGFRARSTPVDGRPAQCCNAGTSPPRSGQRCPLPVPVIRFLSHHQEGPIVGWALANPAG